MLFFGLDVILFSTSFMRNLYRITYFLFPHSARNLRDILYRANGMGIMFFKYFKQRKEGNSMAGRELLEEAMAMQEQLVQNRRHVHMHPEVGFELSETVAFVKGKLKSMGYEPQECGKAGLTATVGGKRPGKVFLLRADMDALPIHEESGVDFASTNENMHACGHDMHVAMLLGAAKLLKARENEINGTVKLMFQPAEEIFLGSKDMIDAGVLKNPDVDAALMIHAMSGFPLPLGSVMVCNGGVSASAADHFEIRVHGKGCHGSMPNTGIDPITAAAHIVTALQEIHAREISFTAEAALTIGSFHAGAVANAIPETAEMTGTIRTYDEKLRCFIKERVECIAKRVGEAFRTEVEVIYSKSCPTLENNADLSDCTAKYLRELLGSENVSMLNQLTYGGKPIKIPGSEDFAFVSHEVPSLMIAVAAGPPEKGYCYPSHHPKIKFDEGALAPGSAIYAYAAMRWLEEH